MAIHPQVTSLSPRDLLDILAFKLNFGASDIGLMLIAGRVTVQIGSSKRRRFKPIALTPNGRVSSPYLKTKTLKDYFISENLKRTDILCAVLRTKGAQAFSDPSLVSDDDGEGPNLATRYGGQLAYGGGGRGTVCMGVARTEVDEGAHARRRSTREEEA
ncbi:uncharacterized protein [Gossypium hirsutum]|uniref:Uncharacterized protein n=1 Tax=Gossypium hirsutum TaxID=3635 RepID=A0ABM3A169_GOSHI|nr:uncharacterized protein LOC121217129 [Gossypium hirsutum]